MLDRPFLKNGAERSDEAAKFGQIHRRGIAPGKTEQPASQGLLNARPGGAVLAPQLGFQREFCRLLATSKFFLRVDKTGPDVEPAADPGIFEMVECAAVARQSLPRALIVGRKKEIP